MNPWNERVQKAMDKLPDDPNEPVSSFEVYKAFLELKDPDGPSLRERGEETVTGLTSPETPYVPHVGEPHVQDPKGQVWMKPAADYVGPIHRGFHLRQGDCPYGKVCIPLTLEEAFRPGAIVRATWESKGGRTTLEGPISGYEEPMVIFHVGSKEVGQGVCTLVTPAPENKG